MTFAVAVRLPVPVIEEDSEYVPVDTVVPYIKLALLTIAELVEREPVVPLPIWPLALAPQQ